MSSMSSFPIATDILDILPNPVLVKNQSLEYVWINKAFEQLFSVSRSEVIGKLDSELFPNRQVSQCNGGDLRVLKTGDTDEAVETVFKQNGIARETITRKSRLDVNETEIYLVGVMHDITEVTRANERLSESEAKLQEQAIELVKYATTDALTGCYNRRKLAECERNAITNPSVSASLLMMDIDKFKSINDNYGHECGDTVLRHFADVVRSTLDEQDIFVRLGGEEFVVVLMGLDANSTVEKADAIRRLVENTPVLHAGQECQFTVSIGLYFKSHGVSDVIDNALRIADKNLYEAKSAGRNRVVLAAA